MNKYYELKVKIKKSLDRVGLLDFFGTAYGIYWGARHWKCNIMAKIRANGYQDKRYKKLWEFAGKHKGERCFVVCTGPSLTVKDVEILKKEYTFSMNSITKIFPYTDWRPTYYVIEDFGGYELLEKDLLMYDMGTRFASDRLIKALEPEIEFVSYPFDPLNHNVMQFCSSIVPKFMFSGNAYAMVYGAITVTNSALQLAVYMGFKEIYLIGCDCDYSGEKRHFEDLPSSSVLNMRPILNAEQKMSMAYEVAKKYCDAHGIKIYNATRGGKLEVFERIDFDSLFE